MRKMIDSGVEWIGEIADTHTIFRLKYLLQSPMQYGANESGDKLTDDSVRYIRITDITAEGNLKDDDSNQYLPITVAEEYILEDKDILFARSGGTVGKSFLYHETYGTCAFAGYLIKAKCDQSVLLPEYLIYYTQSSLYELWKNMIFVQATIQNIGANKYSNMEIPVPSIGKQASIVSCLDEKCSQINALIANVQAQIERLKAYKQSLITEVVTKGLDPTVPMKDSGIEWIGEIPVHWDVLKTGRLFKENNRKPFGNDTPLSLSQVDGLIATDDMKESSLKTATYDNWKRVEIGDLVLNRFKAHLGVLFAATLTGIVSFHYGVYDARCAMVPKYYEYLYHSDQYRAILGSASNGMVIGLQNLSNLNFYSTYSLYPTCEDQEKIVAYLDEKCSQIAQLIAIKQAKIEKLEQYKRSLIYEYVTGKKEVPAHT